MKLGIAAIFKNEYDYILEWIAYHKLMGVDNFYIADNVSDDGSSQLLEALDYLGVIKRVHFPRVGDVGPQVPAYNHILNYYGGEVDLLAFIDADEFIVSTNELSLKENLAAFHAIEDAGALALNWRNFGSSGHKVRSAGPVIERFRRASKKDHDFNRHIKTILKPSMVQKMNIHECTLKSGGYYSGNLEPTKFENGAPSEPKTVDVQYNRVRINHYVVKSRQEHIINKQRKGSGAGSAGRQKGESYFRAHDLNDELDDIMSSFVGDVKLVIKEVGEQLETKSPYLCYGKAVVNVTPEIISGWAISEFEGPLKVRLLINEQEHLVKVDCPRPDVLRKGISSHLNCGFRYKPSRVLTPEDKVEAYIYGTFLSAKVHYSFESVS
ncbi:glycosyltransferase family 92 protein [Microbulbifer epialgicus]|uniref:Glycosyltransferase family 92 protein n=1 Tax=Microbulbifer epialgicus TaxID=393907 RepID=A0ABV4P4T8_9GAMM